MRNCCILNIDRPFKLIHVTLQAGVEQLVLGLYVIRGDNMYVGDPLLLILSLCLGKSKR